MTQQLSLSTAVKIRVCDIEYSLHSHGIDPRRNINNTAATLLTVITHDGIVYEEKDLQRFIADAEASDDVFQKPFLYNVVLISTSPKQSISLGNGVEALLHCYGNERVDVFGSDEIAIDTLPTGPYVSYQARLWQPWRVYNDTQSALMVSLEPHLAHDSKHTVRTALESGSNVDIVVSSRLYARRTPDHPLSSLRVAVKDVFDIRGTRTSLSNKACHDLYDERNRTASAISSLIEKGAIVLGKTRLNSLISKEDPTEAVDYQAPFNPRGDGYQSPAGSSSGSAAAIASYDWLDVTIGTDTNGSGRIPAIVNGCFGLRITHGLLGTDGLVPSFSHFDVPCLFTRDLKMLKHVTQAWLPAGEQGQIEKLPDRVIWLKDYLPTSNPTQMKAIETFTRDLESTLGVERTEISLSQVWTSKPPAAAGSDKLEEFLDEAGWEPVFYDAYHNLDSFREEYEKKFNKRPYVNPYNRWKWALGSTVSREQRDKGIDRILVYRNWLLSEILRVADSNTILILAVDDSQPKYRDAQPKEPQLRNGASALYLSPSLGAPELSIPIAQVPYESVVSGRTEQLPIGVSIIASPVLYGRDLMLVELVEEVFKACGRPSKVLTGSTMY